MRKTILTAACATLIGLASAATASAQFVTGTNEGATATQNQPTDARMNSMNKMKKKKMKKGMMNEGGMSGGMDKGGMSNTSGGMSTGGGMSGSGQKGMTGGGMSK